MRISQPEAEDRKKLQPCKWWTQVILLKIPISNDVVKALV